MTRLPHTITLLEKLSVIILLLFVISGCEKKAAKETEKVEVPEAFFVEGENGKIKYEWADLSVHRLPVYFKGIEEWKLERIQEIGDDDTKKINEELSKHGTQENHYWPRITLAQDVHDQAVAKLSSLFGITKEQAAEALPPREEWRLSITHTEQTEPILESSPELADKYIQFVQTLPFQEVKHDYHKLFKYLKTQSNILEKSPTLKRLVVPRILYVIQGTGEPSDLIFFIYPEDPRWAGVDAYYHEKDMSVLVPQKKDAHVKKSPGTISPDKLTITMCNEAKKFGGTVLQTRHGLRPDNFPNTYPKLGAKLVSDTAMLDLKKWGDHIKAMNALKDFNVTGKTAYTDLDGVKAATVTVECLGARGEKLAVFKISWMQTNQKSWKYLGSEKQ